MVSSGAQEGDLGKHGFRGGKNLHKRLSKTICTNLYTQARLWAPIGTCWLPGQSELGLCGWSGQGSPFYSVSNGFAYIRTPAGSPFFRTTLSSLHLLWFWLLAVLRSLDWGAARGMDPGRNLGPRVLSSPSALLLRRPVPTLLLRSQV